MTFSGCLFVLVVCFVLFVCLFFQNMCHLSASLLEPDNCIIIVLLPLVSVIILHDCYIQHLHVVHFGFFEVLTFIEICK